MNSCSSYRVDRTLADERVLFLRVDVQSAALLAAIKEYEASKWKVIGAKVGKPAKVGKRRDGVPATTPPFLLQHLHIALYTLSHRGG